MDFNGILTNLTFYSSNTFYNQIVSAQSIQIKQIISHIIDEYE